jgi:CRISPR system Cascade subunit CasB
MTATERHAAEANFITALSELERGPLAELRRSLSYRTGQSYFLERLIYDHLPEWYRGGWGNTAAYLVAGLYALVERPHSEPKVSEPGAETAPENPKATAPRNLGYVLGRLYRAQDERPSTEKRFLALLDADEDQLADHLRHAVTLLNAEDIRPDWAQLLSDVLSWNRPASRDRTREQWARAFYRPDPKTAEIDTTESVTTPEETA